MKFTRNGGADSETAPQLAPNLQSWIISNQVLILIWNKQTRDPFPVKCLFSTLQRFTLISGKKEINKNCPNSAEESRLYYIINQKSISTKGYSCLLFIAAGLGMAQRTWNRWWICTAKRKRRREAKRKEKKVNFCLIAFAETWSRSVNLLWLNSGFDITVPRFYRN